MKKLSFVFVILLSFFQVYAIPLFPDEIDGKFVCKYKSYSREYILCLPEDFESKTLEQKAETSIIIMLHGAGSTAEAFMNQTLFHEKACKRDYAVVYITGTVKKNDPASGIVWHYFNDKQSKDDAGFIIELSKYLQNQYGLSSRVFVAGFSNGAFMVTKLASQYSKNFTAAVSVGGMMPKQVWEKRIQKPSVGFLQINGTKDEVVPMHLNGSDNYNPNPAIEEVLNYFSNDSSVVTEQFSTRITKKYYGDKVRWILIEDGYHSWPDKEISGLDCNKTILDFFDEIQGKELVEEIANEPDQLKIFRKSYPDIIFNSEYDDIMQDWKITLVNKNKQTVFYWNNGSMIPPEELENKDKYWTLLYGYNYKKPLRDPGTFTQEEIDAMKKYGSNENRRNGAGTPMFFFDAIYDSYSRVSLEKHIKTVKFLGFSVNVHERLAEPLIRVQNRVMEAAKEDEEIQKFLKSINRNEGYSWRVIANTNRKSFHSIGIALDIQPKSYGGKEVYWSWAKDKNPEKWMLTPLSWRWMPPEKVIEIFEEEGFIWGGKWGIWDNMHFEYHPELINMYITNN